MTWKVYARGTAFLRPFYLEKDGEPYRRKGGAIVYYGSREAAQDAADKMNGARSEYLRGLEDAATRLDVRAAELYRLMQYYASERLKDAAKEIRALAKEGGE